MLSFSSSYQILATQLEFEKLKNTQVSTLLFLHCRDCNFSLPGSVIACLHAMSHHIMHWSTDPCLVPRPSPVTTLILSKPSPTSQFKPKSRSSSLLIQFTVPVYCTVVGQFTPTSAKLIYSTFCWLVTQFTSIAISLPKWGAATPNFSASPDTWSVVDYIDECSLFLICLSYLCLIDHFSFCMRISFECLKNRAI